jgi:hypothetical protein
MSNDKKISSFSKKLNNANLSAYSDVENLSYKCFLNRVGVNYLKECSPSIKLITYNPPYQTKKFKQQLSPDLKLKRDSYFKDVKDHTLIDNNDFTTLPCKYYTKENVLFYTTKESVPFGYHGIIAPYCFVDVVYDDWLSYYEKREAIRNTYKRIYARAHALGLMEYDEMLLACETDQLL